MSGAGGASDAEGFPPEGSAPDGNGGLSLLDLTYDDSLSDLERIARYGTSAIALQRLVHVKLMVDTARLVGCVRAREWWAVGAARPLCPSPRRALPAPPRAASRLRATSSSPCS